MLSFLRSSRPAEVEQARDGDRLLLEECAALSTAHREEVTDRLLVLWNCFVEEFENPAEFHAQPRDAQDAYIAKFERVTARTEGARHTLNGHLHYSVALMLHFLRIARDGARQQSALDLSGRVAVLINEARERQISARRSSIVDALSLSLLDPSQDEKTTVVVDARATLNDAGDSRAKRPRIEFLKQTG